MRFTRGAGEAARYLVAVLAGQADAEVVPQLRSDVGRATVAGDKALPVPQPVRNHQRIPFHAAPAGKCKGEGKGRVRGRHLREPQSWAADADLVGL